ncbi:hypothetical protein QTP88_009791 [Uroleucon formosanum]
MKLLIIIKFKKKENLKTIIILYKIENMQVLNNNTQERASQYFTNLQKLKRGKLTQPPCLKGFTQTINGVLQFFEAEKSNDIVFLMTNRLNQDKLENLFSIFRQNGGYNKNPTAKTIRTSIRSNCIFSLCTSKGTNCEVTHEDDNPVIINPIRPLNKINFNGSTSSDSESNSNLSLFFII